MILSPIVKAPGTGAGLAFNAKPGVLYIAQDGYAYSVRTPQGMVTYSGVITGLPFPLATTGVFIKYNAGGGMPAAPAVLSGVDAQVIAGTTLCAFFYDVGDTTAYTFYSALVIFDLVTGKVKSVLYGDGGKLQTDIASFLNVPSSDLAFSAGFPIGAAGLMGAQILYDINNDKNYFIRMMGVSFDVNAVQRYYDIYLKINFSALTYDIYSMCEVVSPPQYNIVTLQTKYKTIQYWTGNVSMLGYTLRQGLFDYTAGYPLIQMTSDYNPSGIYYGNRASFVNVTIKTDMYNYEYCDLEYTPNLNTTGINEPAGGYVKIYCQISLNINDFYFCESDNIIYGYLSGVLYMAQPAYNASYYMPGSSTPPASGAAYAPNGNQYSMAAFDFSMGAPKPIINLANYTWRK